jgi:hypothetical protein
MNRCLIWKLISCTYVDFIITLGTDILVVVKTKPKDTEAVSEMKRCENCRFPLDKCICLEAEVEESFDSDMKELIKYLEDNGYEVLRK